VLSSILVNVLLETVVEVNCLEAVKNFIFANVEAILIVALVIFMGCFDIAITVY